MAELHTLRSEVTNLRSELVGVRALLQTMASPQGWSAPLSGRLELVPDESANTVSIWRNATTMSAACPRPTGLQPGLIHLLSNLDSGYTLAEVQGDVVLLTPSGQQVRLADPRMVATLVKQGWLARDGQGFCPTALPLTEPFPARES